MFVLSFESLQQLDYLLNYIGCHQTAICNGGMFSHIMTTDSWCQTGYAFQFVSGNNNNYSSCKSSLRYGMNSFLLRTFPKTLRPSCETGSGRHNREWKGWTLSGEGWPSTSLEKSFWISRPALASRVLLCSGHKVQGKKKNGFGKHGEIIDFSCSVTQILKILLVNWLWQKSLFRRPPRRANNGSFSHVKMNGEIFPALGSAI